MSLLNKFNFRRAATTKENGDDNIFTRKNISNRIVQDVTEAYDYSLDCV